MEDYGTLLLIINLVVVLALIAVILVQRNASDGLGGIGGGNSNSFMSARGSANFFTKTTSILAACFLGICLTMAVMQARSSDGKLSSQINSEVDAIESKKIEELKPEDFEVPVE